MSYIVIYPSMSDASKKFCVSPPLTPGLFELSQKPPQLTERLRPLMHFSLSVVTLQTSSGVVGIQLIMKTSPAPEAINKMFLYISWSIALSPWVLFRPWLEMKFPPSVSLSLRSVTIK